MICKDFAKERTVIDEREFGLDASFLEHSFERKFLAGSFIRPT